MDPLADSPGGGNKATLEQHARTQETPTDFSTPNSSSQDAAPKKTPSIGNIDISARRQSFAENLRNAPQSPRHRHPSLTQAAVQELLNHPPAGQRHTNSKFFGREWGEITIGELVSPEDVKWIDMDSSVEDATKVSMLKM